MATFTPSPTLSKLLNILSLGAFIYSTFIYGVFKAKPNIVDIAISHPTFLTASIPVVTLFWIIELSLLAGFCYFQYKPELELTIAEIGYWLTFANSMISLWTFFWLRNEFMTALLVLIAQIFAMLRIMQKLAVPNIQSILQSSKSRVLFVKAPMSLYAGWILPDTVYTFFVAYTDTTSALSLYAAVLAILAIAAIAALVRIGVYKDTWFGAAVALYLFGIALGQTSSKLIFATAGLSATAVVVAPTIFNWFAAPQPGEQIQVDHIQPLLDEQV
jgi:hypothetical protein